MVTEAPYGELTAVEQSLVTAVGRGERLDLASPQAGFLLGESRSCRADVIRDILRGKLAANPDPRGVRLRGAKIIGRLDLENVTTDVNLELTDCLLEEGVLARDARLASVNLGGCRISRPDDCPPLDGTDLTCSALILRRAQVVGRGYAAAVCLSTARINGRFDCTEATLRSDSGAALNADSLEVAQDMFLYGATAVCGGADSAVRLAGAKIAGGLDCTEATLRSDSGAALNADRLKVAEGVLLRRLSATGSGNAGAVRLSGTEIGGQLDCRGAGLVNNSGPALFADSLKVGQALILADGFTAIGGGEGVAVDLTGAQVIGPFVFDPERLEHAADPYRLAADGLTYAGVPERISPRAWMRLLRYGTPSYAAQPYQQLAVGYRALGDDRQVRGILMAQRDDQLARTPTRRAERLWGQISRVTLGYGYQPSRLVWWLSAVVALSCVLAVALGPHGALAQTDKTATPGRPCTVIQELSVGMDLNLPFGTSLARQGCDLAKKPSAAANWLTSAGLVLRVAAWAFAALFAAAIAGAIRKT